MRFAALGKKAIIRLRLAYSLLINQVRLVVFCCSFKSKTLSKKQLARLVVKNQNVVVGAFTVIGLLDNVQASVQSAATGADTHQ